MAELPIAVVGVMGDSLPKEAARALEATDLVVGGARHLEAFAPLGTRRVVMGEVGAALDVVAAEAGKVCVLASGDPGFFGIGRALAARFGPGALELHPAPSSVAVAFARLGRPWDDAVVVSAHGRPLEAAARRATTAATAAVLTSPDARPEDLGRELRRLGAGHRAVAVASRLGTPDEDVVETDLAGLAAGTWDPVSVVVLLDGPVVAPEPVLAWGRQESAFAHRDGMVTKAEVRAVALGKLALPPAGVLWDVGAGSGSVAIEAALLVPGLRAVAVERRPEDVRRIRANAAGSGVRVEVVEGEAPAALASLPDPDRVFVGGGGLGVLDSAVARLRPGGRVVATYARLDRAAAAFERLGAMVQVGLARARPLPGGGVRLAAENPVFVAWGPDHSGEGEQ